MDIAPSPRRPRGRMPIRFERSVKPGGGLRLLSRLDPADLRHLQRIVARLGPRVEASLGPEVRANRLLGVGSALMPWGPARRAWAAEIDRKLRAGPRNVLVTDVRDCYSSIQAPVLTRAILKVGGDEELARALSDLLAGLHDEGLQGLPIGPDPSAVLANLVLAGADQTLRETGAPHIRWVDDFVVFTEGRPHSLRALDALRRSLGESGLEVSEPKTALLDAHEARARLLAGLLPTSGSGVA